MANRLALALTTAVLGACASAPPPPTVTPQTLADYKRAVAMRITALNTATYSVPPPEMLKSVVVLEITLDSVGAPLAVSVLRSNGYRELSQRAIASVIDASPFAAPAPALLQDDAVRFLETFLFRDDDSFQLRSLVGDTWKSSTTSPAALTD
jgi:TonB family protein